MKNVDEPFYNYRSLYAFRAHQNATIGLGPNSFTDNKDKIGLFSSENEPRTWLTVKELSSQWTIPGISISLMEEQHEYERSAFTLMMLLGELGGMYGIVVALPSYFLASTVEHMFMNQVALQMMPKKRKMTKPLNGLEGDQLRRDSQTNQMRQLRLRQRLQEAQGSLTLTPADIQCLKQEALRFTKMKTVSFMRLFKSSLCKCRRDKKVQKASEFYDEFMR